MSELLPLLVFVGALAAILGFFAWLASLARRRGVAGAAIRAAMASHDEAFRITAHDSYYEIQVQAERKVPIPSPDDPWKRRRVEAAQRRAGGRRPPRPRARRSWWGPRRRGQRPRRG
ncbi:hypothetical protein [Streptomyces albipurpureus]|uniref:Secreted protein n=1 Tax=Streptomyces albipurpureus TaxID=2897419 RepID=A0ABT0UNW4_9ACTN|nr:hypothetical protein [Streptomyces sp. CWNU-1]MCM2390297.1 hypothetical protein [Streptomyces sp. CWNU-1]